ncbi:MAG: hypothetical protein ACW99A_22560 [Candidatus Kariarchaeaceae archaeon]|jgi:hypothetical protein
MKTKYQCYYQFGSEQESVRSDSFADFKDGFWLDENMKFTNGIDIAFAKFWIPPSMIFYIKKVQVEE